MGRNPSSFGPLIKPAKSSRNSICSRILYFHTTYSNGHILILKYQNHAIRKPKIINTFTNTTFMNDIRSDKIVLKVKIWAQDEGQDWSPGLMRKLMVTRIPL
jgi:hypothetical protein